MCTTPRFSTLAFRFVFGSFLFLIAIGGTTLSAQTIGLNFTGSNLSQSGFRPPDTMGTVGSNHIVEMINGRYAVYDKTSGSSLTSSSLDSFWSTAGAPPADKFSFDPRVQYDPFEGRFYAASVDNSRNANNILFAVSNTANPLDGWTGFSVDADTDDVQWADFPQMGFSSDSIVISNNMFAITSGDPFQVNMLVIPKADILSATPSISGATLLEDQYAITGGGFSLQAAIDLDNSGRPLRLFSNSAGGAGTLATIQIDGGPTSPFVNNIPDVSGLTAYSPPPLADQPGTQGTDLDSGGNRTRSSLKLIGGSYYGIHGVEDPTSGNAALQWYKINADTMLLEDEGLIADSDLDLIYGSIAANAFGDIVIGFTGSSESQYASSYAVVGDTDINNDISFGNLMLLKEGLGEYELLVGSRNRWGDYSATVLDPDDPFHFWTFQEFASAENHWSIQITEIIISPVPEPTGLALLIFATIGLTTIRRRKPYVV